MLLLDRKIMEAEEDLKRCEERIRRRASKKSKKKKRKSENRAGAGVHFR